MPLDVKVKTLDSQNYEFKAEDDWTVSRFKEHIQETVNVPAPEQRLIFCGRVLQNDKKLVEYDVGGKVVHLVRRPPPASDQPDNDPLAAGANSADSNNNDGNYSFRFGEDNNVLFSAMTLGPDGNMNQILRHIMTLQQAIYSRTFGGPTTTGEISDPDRDLDRRLTNAARLLRITVNVIAECNTRLPASSPIAIRGATASSNQSSATDSNQAEPVNLATPQSVLSAALSHSDLQSEPSLQASGETSAPGVERMTVDDSDLGSPSTSAQATSARRPSRQSLTTDDLPQGNSRPARPFAPIDELRTRNENRNGPMTPAQRDDFYMDRYMTILNCSSDVQSQIRVLIRRYREVIGMLRCGGLVTPGAETRQASEGQSRAPLTAQELADGNNAATASSIEQQYNISESIRREARMLSHYVPRILHHHSHLQHALSDFTIDSSRGRLTVPQLPPAPRRPVDRPRYVARRGGRSVGPRPAQLARSDPMGRPEVVGAPTTLTAQTQAGATIVISENGIHTPVTIPQVVTDADVTWGDPHEREIIRIEIAAQPIISQAPSSREHSQTRSQSGNAQQAPNADQGQQSGQRTAQETTSNSTQTASRPFGIISGRIPLPFDYYLTCFSPLAHHIIPARSSSATRAEAAPQRVHVASSRSSQESAPGAGARGQPGRAAPGAMPTSQPLDSGLTEVVSNIIGSIFRPPPGQPGQPDAARNTAGAPNNNNASQDPFMNMIPELVINAASQILGGVFGIQNDGTNRPPGAQQQSNSQQQRQEPVAETQAGPATVVMDIDIDEHYTTRSHSESIYHDARESQPACTATSAAQAQTNAASRAGHSSRSHDNQAHLGEPSGLEATYSREQLSEVFRDHPDWVPIIEADIRFMERQRALTSPTPAYFSDAYLASIPRKRRRLLVSNPEHVLILQPSPSQAISNLLQRAIASSNLSVSAHDQALAGIANDQAVQRAYEEYLKSAVEERLKTDEDYNESKYTNSSRYFK